VEEATLSCEIVKITLQPIVENALVHAFVHTGGRGRLAISARLQQDTLCVTIADNGSGMTQEQLQYLLESADGTRDREGFGVYNVNERLKRHYGHTYRMQIRSAPGEGTSFQMFIPQNKGRIRRPVVMEGPDGDQSIRSG
jgi:sensor histidine kinase YesM